jgi:hypothetical protein
MIEIKESLGPTKGRAMLVLYFHQPSLQSQIPRESRCGLLMVIVWGLPESGFGWGVYEKSRVKQREGRDKALSLRTDSSPKDGRLTYHCNPTV